MPEYTITIGGSKRLPIIVHADNDREIDSVIYDGLEAAGYFCCDGCDQWRPEMGLRVLKGADGSKWYCDWCHEEAVADRYRHEDGCHCEECREGRAYARGEI